MRNKELYGRRILDNCLPPTKYSVDFGGNISITENIGITRVTKGKDTPGAKRFKAFLESEGVLLEFIENSFSGAVVYSVRENLNVLIGSWVRYSFNWGGTRGDWEGLSRKWNASLPRNHREYGY